MLLKKMVLLTGILWLVFLNTGNCLPRLRVSDNGRYLVTEDGKAFFWLGDTSWGLIRKSSREKTELQPGVEEYFKNRSDKGFNVLQTVAGASLGNIRNYNQKHWEHVDYIIRLAEQYRIYLALLPLWGNSLDPGDELLENPQSAYELGQFLGRRYADETHIIWIMGGDTWEPGKQADNPKRLAMIRAMAEGITDGVNGESEFDGIADYTTTLMSYHPQGRGYSSSYFLHMEPWLDFNMIQSSSHFVQWNYESIERDYALWPRKPVMESEVAYEYSRSLYEYERGTDRRMTSWDVRRAAYWGVFAGGFGHTYGHRCFIQWVRKGEEASWGADRPWYEMLDAEGAFDMGHLRSLMESRPFLDRIPDQSLLAIPQGNAYDHMRATRDAAGTYAMIYCPVGKPVSVNMDKFAANFVRASWFNPRDGSYNEIKPARFITSGVRTFYPPTRGEGEDWVLILDVIYRDYS